jgi:hypothetical protein
MSTLKKLSTSFAKAQVWKQYNKFRDRSTVNRDDNFTRGYRYPWVSYPMGTGMGTKFYPRVVHVPDLRFGRYAHKYCLPPAGNPWISEIKLNSYLAQ